MDTARKTSMQKFIDIVERGTRFIPSPIKMFLYLILFVVVISTLLYYGGVVLEDPMTGNTTQAMNMVSKDSIQWFLSNMITNFTGYMAFGPIIVPIFVRLGWTPALAQAAFRVSDSATNCMSPISPFLFMMIDIAKDTFKCKDTSTSKWLSLLVPSCLIMLAVWTALLVLWILLDLPLGPGAAIHM